ncbi:hypothetical protein PHLCEN_2v10578 [Hermanssonia centrifuga]|uniref:Uncharacterized protein n=1 Tax=Hermanssonia centrifuga TaxID=98765 RepID=A0A2R6NMP2_9APHY|nr:hypothetical protein PHLCEN_2v10578 [Hermanssonia centrifuga]
MVNYGGDEVSALVIDIGTSSLRAGYAGDDTPKAVIPTCYGFKSESIGEGDVSMAEPEEEGGASAKPEKKVKLYIGQSGPSVWRDGMQIAHPVQNSLSLSHSALPMLVQAHAKHLLTSPYHNRAGIQLLPHQLIANKQTVDTSVPPRFTLRDERVPGTTETWRAWYEAKETEEWIQSVAGVIDQGWNEQAAAQRGVRHYEFPTGYNFYFGAERLQVGEQYFTHSPQLVASNPNLPKTIPALISSALSACDPDLRQVLLGNIVLTGGGSLLSGFADRLSVELQRNVNHVYSPTLFPDNANFSHFSKYQVKIHAPGNPTERRFGGWLGGSILASLGTFHQLWISKEEWQEHGKAIVGQRCK